LSYIGNKFRHKVLTPCFCQLLFLYHSIFLLSFTFGANKFYPPFLSILLPAFFANSYYILEIKKRSVVFINSGKELRVKKSSKINHRNTNNLTQLKEIRFSLFQITLS